MSFLEDLLNELDFTKKDIKEEKIEEPKELSRDEIDAKYYDLQVQRYLERNVDKTIVKWDYKVHKPMYYLNDRNLVVIEYKDGSSETIAVFYNQIMGEIKIDYSSETRKKGSSSNKNIPLSKVKKWLNSNLEEILNGYLNAKENGEYTYQFILGSDSVIESDKDFEELCSLMATQPFEIHQAANALLLQWE